MKRDLNKKILCSILALGLCGAVNCVSAANSGGNDETVEKNNAYVGNNGTSSNNSVYFDTNSNKQYASVIGGYVKNGEQGDANYNTVVVSNVELDGGIYGGYVDGDGNGNYNNVIVSNVTCNDIIGGGNMKDTASPNSQGSYNNVVVNGSYVMNNVIGGGVAHGSGAQANNNSVVINNSKIDNNIYGGSITSGEGTANNNSVVINNSEVKGSIYGGMGIKGEANNNSITIAGNSVLTKASLYGGHTGFGSYKGVDNKLILDGFSGGDKKVGSLNNFNSIEVKALANGEYNNNDEVIVITADKVKYCYIDTTQTAYIGVARKAEGTISINNDNGVVDVDDEGKITDTDSSTDIKFKIKNIKAAEQTAITTETRAAAAAFVNQGAEIVTDSLDMLSREEEGINTIAIVSGNNSKYKTGSYIDINGWNNLIGIANTKEIGNDKLNYSAFFENGSGNYNTFNDFDGNALRGDGNVVYNGGGMAVRFDKENGFYTEAAVRAGSVKNEVSNALSNGSSTYGYETDNTYYGGHIGIGKTFKLENGKAWDIYGKYFYMHYEDDSIMIAGDRFDFDSVDSNKLRIGARFSEQQGEKLTSYYGLAWDYEFSGDVSGTAAGYDMHSPSLEGSTVIGEVGFRYTPGKESPWSFDAKLRGYVGQQEGISGNVQAVYSF